MNIELLRKLISYDPNTGSMVWLPRDPGYFKSYRGYAIWTARYEGREVGCVHTLKSGYTFRVFSLQALSSSRISCHRAAWAIQTGQQPPAKIDHINQDATDNRWINLRDGTLSVNERNMYRRKDNSSGYQGVSWSKKREKWEAHVGHQNKKINLGLFTSAEEAAKAAAAKRREIGFSPLHGRLRPKK